jgi:hypothetical protein
MNSFVHKRPMLLICLRFLQGPWIAIKDLRDAMFCEGNAEEKENVGQGF